MRCQTDVRLIFALLRRTSEAMAICEILQLGNPRLHEGCATVTPEELSGLSTIVSDLHDTLMDFRSRYGIGRAIAAPQIGVMKRLVYMHTDRSVVFVNPVLHAKSRRKYVLWDDCMSFPDLLVRVARHYSCKVTYRDIDWREHTLSLTGGLSELLQHECDHLDGILAVARAVDGQSLALKSQSALLDREPREAKGS